MIKKLTCFIVVFALFSFALTNNFRELVLEKLNAYSTDYPEKVYVQTDKPYYATGEDIWYTAYLVNGMDHKRSDKSQVVYVELINEQDSVLIKKQLYTNDISVAGDFKIKKGWKPGNYLIRAYTNYMRNKDTDYFFQKEIPIWNVSNSASLENTTQNTTKNPPIETQLIEKPEITFYPEGGYLINNINSKVAIKVKDKNNRNITVQGFIKDSDNNIVTTFSTYEFGLGIISLTPAPNKNYHASILIDNQEVKYPLPKTLTNGYALSIVNNGNQLILKATTNYPIGLKNSFLVAHQRGRLIFEKLETENKQSYSVKVNTESLPDGVAHFTLFDGAGNPVCERLAFIDNPNNKVLVNLSSNNESPKTRDKVTLEVDLTDKDSNPLSGNLSISITDLDAVGQSSKYENIKTHLLLNSDLRGKIQDPGYFFEKENDPKRKYLLDLLMLTHGWRRFTWNAILYSNKEQEDAFIPEKGLYITGHTSALKESRQQIQAQTRLTFMGAIPYQESKQSNVNGTFRYGPYVFHDSIPTLIEARVKDFKSDDDKKNRFVSIFLDEDFYKSPKIIRNTVLKPNIDDHEKITNFLKQSASISEIDDALIKSMNILNEIVITAQKETVQEKREKTLNERTNYGQPSNRIDLNDIIGSESLSVFDLLNTLPGVSAFNNTISIRNGGTPGIYLDGFEVQISDISYLTGSDIEFIDVLKGANASFFSNSANGIIAIHSKTGSNASTKNIKRKPGIIDFSADGFYTAREFYAPDHLNGFDESIKQDIRTTLHWEPKIVLNSSKNKAEVSFYTSDKKSKYAIKIEGITNSGIPIYHLSTFEVE